MTEQVTYNTEINGKYFDVCACSRCHSAPTMVSKDYYLYGTYESYDRTEYHLSCYTCDAKGAEKPNQYEVLMEWNRKQQPVPLSIIAICVTVAFVVLFVLLMVMLHIAH